MLSTAYTRSRNESNSSSGVAYPNFFLGRAFNSSAADRIYSAEYLRHSTFEPRPNYFAVKLWQDLVGNTVYDSGIPVEQGKHVYCHSRKDGKEGFVYLVINNSWTDTTTVELPKDAVKYALDGNGDMRSTVLYLNSKPLTLGENDELPDLSGEPVPAGSVEVVPGGCVFFVL